MSVWVSYGFRGDIEQLSKIAGPFHIQAIGELLHRPKVDVLYPHLYSTDDCADRFYYIGHNLL